MLLFFSPLLFS